MGFVYSLITHSLFLNFLCGGLKLPHCLTDSFTSLVIIVFPFGVLPCRLRLQSWRYGVVDWKGRESGWGSGGKGLLVVARILRK